MRKQKTLLGLVLSLSLIFGSSLTALANSGSCSVGGATVAYSSYVSESTGTAFTTSNGAKADVAVSSTYYWHQNVTYTSQTPKSDSASGSLYAGVSFSCPTGYATSYIYSTHNASSGSSVMSTQTTTASY